MYKIDKNFFKEINSPEKAYVLGFIYADGYNSMKLIVITQLKQDKDILEKINKCLDSNNPIHDYINDYKHDASILTINSLEMCKDISTLGAIKNKSLTLTFPSDDIVPKKFKRDFIRGYFDGDGCIWNGKRKKMVVKDSASKTGFRERIVHNVKFTFTGCFSFIDSLLNYLVSELGLKKTKLNFSKAKNPNNHISDSVCTMEYSGRINIKKLFDFMYTDALIYGDRKYNKFLEIFCASGEKSSEDTSLIAGTPETVISSQANEILEGSSTIPEMGVESSDSKCEAPNSMAEGEDIVSSTVK